ncbi:Mitochondrial import inner membrane translocase subunit tim54 [Penicillium digitatum]|uniref:Mitochondrial import inner membrane translocase subunit TIM54 n=2 Tax=Penicillium digitatum TaxID=36651 RepID=K9G144_PEND1|nr:Mitochondrial import inner membrane translocase subunit tim54 [Penicillium digitatum Pd1]EKV14587.1 Mitochondrial import inner membrane translocase subunit tim54 [Penicillium digitatum Pd1]QQK45943.1 Mitochondrial import inner membrane translocase subunit tim54 [Penicillium digitatum]
MADSSSSAAPSGASKPQAAPKPPNPAFKMMGLPNMRFKLPSRNWMIFLTITGSFTGALIYDRREKRRVQQKWSELVAHISKETLPVDQMRRKLTVYLAAPPGDGLRVARDHFKEYVKPILVAAALDYTVVEGRREGDVRANTAENIRKLRRKAGEPSSAVEEAGVDAVVAATRAHIGVTDEPGPKGDLIIGRHTWKEYIRGLHEGWLGPLDAPPPPLEELTADTPKDISAEKLVSLANPEIASIDSPEFSEEKKDEIPEPKIEEPEKEEEKPAKPAGPTPAYIYPSEYSSAILPHTIPQSFDSSIPVEFPHLLGFLNTPIRVYRFLTQRHLAEDVGREVAALVLANSARPYHENTLSVDSEPTAANVDPTPSPDSSFTDLTPRNHEQQTVMEAAESEWHKSVHKRDEDGNLKEREWLDDVVLDQRIASRMQRATLSLEDEARSQRIAEQQEYILGEERPAPVPFWKRMWIDYGYGESDEVLRRKPILGNIDGEDVQ